MSATGESHITDTLIGARQLLPQIPTDPIEFLSRSWTPSTTQLSKALSVPTNATMPENATSELEEELSLAGNPFSFASSATSQLVLERIMSQSQEVSPLTSGRLSHSSGPLNSGSLTDSPPISPSEIEEKLYRLINTPRTQQWGGGSRTVGRWLKDRREKKKEEARAHNANLHAAISLAGVAAAVAAIASATATAAASSSNKDARTTRTDIAVAAAATLVASQCVEGAEALGAEREHLASVVGSAVNVRSPGDIATLTAAAATALRGAVTLKARALKEACNIAAVIPMEKGVTVNNDNHGHWRRTGDEDLTAENFVGLCNQELLARGTELLKRTRKGALHWKVVSVYIHRTGVVMLKMKSRHVAGTFTKKKKNAVTGVCKDVEAWPGRHLLEGSERRWYFGLRTAVDRRVIEFECRSRREYEVFTIGVSRLLEIVAGKKKHCS